jgi:hypothetical protein
MYSSLSAYVRLTVESIRWDNTSLGAQHPISRNAALTSNRPHAGFAIPVDTVKDVMARILLRGGLPVVRPARQPGPVIRDGIQRSLQVGNALVPTLAVCCPQMLATDLVLGLRRAHMAGAHLKHAPPLQGLLTIPLGKQVAAQDASAALLTCMAVQSKSGAVADACQ